MAESNDSMTFQAGRWLLESKPVPESFQALTTEYRATSSTATAIHDRTERPAEHQVNVGNCAVHGRAGRQVGGPARRGAGTGPSGVDGAVECATETMTGTRRQIGTRLNLIGGISCVATVAKCTCASTRIWRGRSRSCTREPTSDTPTMRVPGLQPCLWPPNSHRTTIMDPRPARRCPKGPRIPHIHAPPAGPSPDGKRVPAGICPRALGQVVQQGRPVSCRAYQFLRDGSSRLGTFVRVRRQAAAQTAGAETGTHGLVRAPDSDST